MPRLPIPNYFSPTTIDLMTQLFIAIAHLRFNSISVPQSGMKQGDTTKIPVDMRLTTKKNPLKFKIKKKKICLQSHNLLAYLILATWLLI
jgi:hypothetical protein